MLQDINGAKLIINCGLILPGIVQLENDCQLHLKHFHLSGSATAATKGQLVDNYLDRDPVTDSG